MNAKQESTKQKFIPGSLSESSEIFNFPFTADDCTMDFLKDHGRIMFIIRGPPGTGKDSLTKILTDQYPGATMCSADSYFGNTFSSSQRDPQSLRLSHEYCHTKVKSACQRNNHPIIVKNTHMKKFELQKYVGFAAEYNYTVIMAVTIHKFEVTPEILARSNTKGLNVEYFQRRLKQWEEVVPLLVGWFLNPEDSFYLLNELQKALDSLLGDGKFCRILNVFDKGGLFKHYKARKLLYCTAACGENRSNEIKNYYLSKNVQENYGKCSTITIIGYLVTPSSVSAVVYLNENQKNLRYIRESSKHRNDGIDSLIKGFSSLDLEGNLKKHSITIDFDVNFKSTKTTAKQEKKCEDEVINISHCSSMLLAESDEVFYSPIRSVHSFFKLLNGAANANGVIRSDQLIELDENMKVYRLSENAWFIKPPYGLSFKSIYTGLYV